MRDSMEERLLYFGMGLRQCQWRGPLQ